MKVLCVGDLLLPSEELKKAIEEDQGESSASIREVTWSTGESIGEQRRLQHSMEQYGLEFVPDIVEIIDFVGDAEAIAVHFAPITEAVLEAAENKPGADDGGGGARDLRYRTRRQRGQCPNFGEAASPDFGEVPGR